MRLFSAFEISGSALTAEKTRLDVIAGNLANINTTRSPEGGPYRRRTAVFAEHLDNAEKKLLPRLPFRPDEPLAEGRGVYVQAVLADHRPPRMVYDPEHVDADENGMVAYPNIEMAKEMTDLITALRSYESSVTALNTAKSMYLKALEIGR